MDPQNAIAVNPIDLPRTVCDRPIVLGALRATPGLREWLACGIHVADIGCGAGVSKLTMAVAFPRSRFLGVDADPASLERARPERSAACATCTGSPPPRTSSRPGRRTI